jgi:hypothetical protein
MGASTPQDVVLRHIELYNDGTPEIYGTERFLEVWADDAAHHPHGRNCRPTAPWAGRYPMTYAPTERTNIDVVRKLWAGAQPARGHREAAGMGACRRARLPAVHQACWEPLA